MMWVGVRPLVWVGRCRRGFECGKQHADREVQQRDYEAGVPRPCCHARVCMCVVVVWSVGSVRCDQSEIRKPFPQVERVRGDLPPAQALQPFCFLLLGFCFTLHYLQISKAKMKKCAKFS